MSTTTPAGWPFVLARHAAMHIEQRGATVCPRCLELEQRDQDVHISD